MERIYNQIWDNARLDLKPQYRDLVTHGIGVSMVDYTPCGCEGCNKFRRDSTGRYSRTLAFVPRPFKREAERILAEEQRRPALEKIGRDLHEACHGPRDKGLLVEALVFGVCVAVGYILTWLLYLVLR